jgi:PGF-pre-PGF domain-containing protein
LDQTSTKEKKITENTNSTESTESTDSSNSTLINNSYDQKDNNIIILMNESTSNEQMDSYITSANINIYLEGDIGNITINNQISVITTEKEKYRSIIKQVDFATHKYYTDVHITISELEDRPDEVTTEPNLYQKNKIYKYLDIKLIAANSTYIGEKGISAMTFTFTIQKSWIEDYKLDRNTIVMMRYHNDTWQNLTTTNLNETEEFLYFSAETPGLSIFAVVGNEIIEDSDAIVDKSIQIPIWFTFGVVLSSSTLLGIVLVKKRFIYRT